MKLKCLSIIGARPQFIKAAPMSLELLKRSNFIDEIIIHTGQHFDKNMSEIFFSELNIPEPKYKLGINGGSHANMTADMLSSIENVIELESPDFVIVYGDTNSTLAGALAAAKLHVPVVHIEAGLRSFNKEMPEEINRLLTDHVSDLLLCPTKVAVNNLSNEGIKKNVFVVGDLMLDTLKLIDEQLHCKNYKFLERLPAEDYILLSLHRQENVDCKTRFKRLISYIEKFSEDNNLPIVFPVHPRTKNKISEFSFEIKNCFYLKPLSYIEMQLALKNAKYLLTDSGGLQKESYFHRVPCVTLRDQTEWLETIEAGWNRLWLSDDYKGSRRDIAAYGDGKSAKDIADIILRTYGEITKDKVLQKHLEEQ